MYECHESASSISRLLASKGTQREISLKNLIPLNIAKTCHAFRLTSFARATIEILGRRRRKKKRQPKICLLPINELYAIKKLCETNSKSVFIVCPFVNDKIVPYHGQCLFEDHSNHILTQFFQEVREKKG